MSKIIYLNVLIANLIFTSCTKNLAPQQASSSSPRLSLMMPNMWSYEDKVIIKGSNFGNKLENVEIKFNDQKVHISEFSSIQITPLAPDLNLLGNL